MTRKNPNRGEAKPGVTFLVVDDDEAARETIVEYLRSFGYTEIVLAPDGLAAQRLLEERKIDFIIADWEMPGATGLDLLRKLKADERYRHIPFIMVSSPISKERFKVEDAASLNIAGYVIKPFRAEVLREKIVHALVAANVESRKAALVVDDDDEARHTIVEYVERFGYAPIYEARDGDEGFASLQLHAREIAFVISDWEMPRLAGIELLRRIRTDAELGATPFIMVTSQTSIERLKVQQALDADVDNYLLKPFRQEDLKAKIEQSLASAKTLVAVEQKLQRGHALLQAEQWNEARKAFNQALGLDARCARAYLGLAEATKHLAPEQDLSMALQYIRKAINLNPTHPRAHIALALFLEAGMSLDRAIGVLRAALEHCVFSDEIHFHLGRILIRRGAAGEGVLELKRALEINPDHVEAKALLESRS